MHSIHAYPGMTVSATVNILKTLAIGNVQVINYLDPLLLELEPLLRGLNPQFVAIPFPPFPSVSSLSFPSALPFGFSPLVLR